MSVTSRDHEDHDGAEVAEVLLASSDESLSPEDPQDNSDEQDAAMPSSPPQSKEGMSQPQEVMGPPKISASQARKRTRDEMAMADQDQSSSALPGAINASPVYQDEHFRVSRDTSATIRQDTQTQSTQSYHDAPLTTPCPPESRPPSGQGDNIGLKASALPSHPQQPKVTAASVSSHTESDLGESEQESDASSSTRSSRPEERIQAFDWDELLIQYHEKMNKATAEEHGILKEFRELSKYFNVWAQTGCGKEVDRSFKRLKTQQAYVQNEERQLEEKRVHYVKVVDAFKTFADLFHPGERWTTTTVRIHSANSIQDANEQADAPESTAPKEQHHYASGSNVSAQLTSWATRLSTTADVEPHFRSSYHPARCTIM